MSTNANLQSFNNLTGDISITPQSFGLFMRDIDSASLGLKTSIYNGNVNLTANLYKQLTALSEAKYNAIEPDGSINTTRLSDTDMTGENPGLYMNHQRLGFWDGDEWMAFIGNTGEMWLGNVLGTNYLHWNGTELDIRGTLLLSDGTSVEDAIDDIDVSWNALSGKPIVLSDVASFTPPVTGSGFKLTNTHLGYYNNGSWKTYMENNGNFGLGSTSAGNGLTWNGSILTVRGNIQATSISGAIVSTSNLTFTPVETSNVVASINATSEGIKISGSKIQIDGTVTFSSGYDPSTKETPTGAQDKVNTLSSSLGSLAYDSLVEEAKLGTSVIQGGYIVTSLINTGAIVIGDLSGAGDLAGLNVINYESSFLSNKPTLGVLAALNSVNATYIEDGSIVLTKLGSSEQGKLNNGDTAYDSTSLWKYTGSTYINGGKIYTNSITANQIDTGSISIGVFSGNLDDIDNGSTYKKTTTNEKTGAGRGFSALNSSNRYAQWLTTTELQSGTDPTTGVIIDSAGIRGYYGSDKKFEIKTSDGSAFFKGEIGASSVTSTLGLGTNGSITAGTSTDFIRIRRPSTTTTYNGKNFNGIPIIEFQDDTTNVGAYMGFDDDIIISHLYIGTTGFSLQEKITINCGNSAIMEFDDLNNKVKVTTGTFDVSTKMKLPVGTNLY